MTVKQTTLDERIAGVQSRFDQLESQRQQEIGKRKVIDQNISTLTTELIGLSGEHKALVGLKDNGKPAKPELVIPKGTKKSGKKKQDETKT